MAEDNSKHRALPQVDAAALPLAGMSRNPTYDQLEEHSPAVLRRGGCVAERVMPADTAATDVTYFIGDGESEAESAPTPPGPSIREDSMMSYYAVPNNVDEK